MKLTQLLESVNQTFDKFVYYVYRYIVNHLVDSLEQIVSSSHARRFRTVYSNNVYRVWELTQEQVNALRAGETVTFKTQYPVLSFSWSQQGVHSFIDSHYAFPSDPNKIAAIVKKKLRSKSDVLFNIEHFVKWFLEKSKKDGITEFSFEDPAPYAPKGNAKVEEFVGLEVEQEVLITATPYYLTIEPGEVVEIQSE